MSEQEVSSSPGPFRRATGADARALAGLTFRDGRRIDMGVLAGQLGIGRATLYRWVGSREELLEEVLEGVAADLAAVAREQAEGEGDERVVEFIRLMLDGTMRHEAVRSFVRREPELALRLLISESGRVSGYLRTALGEVLAEARTPAEVVALGRFVGDMVQVATAHQWAVFSIGDTPQSAPVVEIARVLLAARPTRE